MIIDISTAQKTEALGFQASPVAQIVTRHRRIVEANKAIDRLFGYNREELVNRSIQRLYPTTADFKKIGERCSNQMLSTGDSYYEDERFMQTKGGEIIWARAKGITLTPKAPFALMTWSFEKIISKSYRSVNLSPRESEVARLLVNAKLASRWLFPTAQSRYIAQA